MMIPRIPYDKRFPYHEEDSPDRDNFMTDRTDHLVPKRRGFITDMIYNQRGHEAPPIFTIWAALSLLSAVYGRKLWLKQHGGLYTNLYVLLTGPAGQVKKSTTLNLCSRLALAWNDYWKASPYYPLMEVQVFSDSVTPEAIVKRLKSSGTARALHNPATGDEYRDGNGQVVSYYRDSACYIFGDEITATVSSDYQKGKLEFLKAIYDPRATYVHETKGDGKHVMHDLHTNFLGSTTLQGMKALPETSAHDGFQSRMTMVYAFSTDRIYPQPWLPQGAPTQSDLLDGLAMLVTNHQGEMTMTPEAKNWYETLYRKLRKVLPGSDNAGVLSRQTLMLLKVATLAAASEYNDSAIITLEHMEWSWHLINYTYGNNPTLSGAFQDDSDFPLLYERVRGFLYRNNDDETTIRELSSGVRFGRKRAPVAQLTAVLDQLHKEGNIMLYQPKGTPIEPGMLRFSSMNLGPIKIRRS